MNVISKNVYDKLRGKPDQLKKSILANNSNIENVHVPNEVSVNSDSEIAIVLSHANTEERKLMLNECLSAIKIETLLSSNYLVDTDTQKLTDWLLYDKNNHLLLESEYDDYGVSYFHWKRKKDGDIIRKLFAYEHGYAVYILIRNALLFSRSIGKMIAHIINYDYLITEKLLVDNSNYLKYNDIVVYEDSTGEHKSQYCTGLFSGDIDSLLTFFQRYKSKREYYADFDNSMSSSYFIEGKMFKFFNSKPFKIKEKSFNELKNENGEYPGLKINRETLIRETKFDDSTKDYL
jgi:hypothetical protein